MTRRMACLVVALLLGAYPAAAEERYALVVVGAPGGQTFVATYTTWAAQLTSVFTGPLGFPQDQVIVLSGSVRDDPVLGRALAAGADAYVDKMDWVDDLKSTILRLAA